MFRAILAARSAFLSCRRSSRDARRPIRRNMWRRSIRSIRIMRRGCSNECVHQHAVGYPSGSVALVAAIRRCEDANTDRPRAEIQPRSVNGGFARARSPATGNHCRRIRIAANQCKRVSGACPQQFESFVETWCAFAPGGPPPGSTDIKLYSVGFDAPWEIDIFGGVRRGVEAARANTEAAVWQMRDGEVTLTAEIATDYMTLRALQARVAFLREEEQRQIDTSPLVAA